MKNKEIIMTTLPIAIAQVHDMADFSYENETAQALLIAAEQLLGQALDIISNTMPETYYHVEYNDSFDTEEGDTHPFLNSTVVSHKYLAPFINDDLVSIEKISKDEYDRYRRDYGDDSE